MSNTIAILSKMLGGVSGSIIAISIMRPKSIMDGLRRLLSSVILAYYLTTPVAHYIDDAPSIEFVTAISMLIGLFGWFIVSMLLGTIASAKSLKELREKLK